MSSTARRLLVATPTLLDPNFFRTVVFMIEHTAGGRARRRPEPRRPTPTLDEAMPEWCALAAEPRVAFVGGPVQPHEAVIALGRGRGELQPADGWYPLLGHGRHRRPRPCRRPTSNRRSRRSGCSPATPPGAPVSSTASSRSTAGTSSTPSPTISSPPIPTRCGDGCCDARAASWRWRRTIPLDPGTN